MRGCIQQHEPAAPVVARRVEPSRLDALDMAKGILLPGKVALGRVTEEVRCLAGVIFAVDLIFRPALHFLRGDGQGDYPPAGRQSSNTYDRGMAVGEIAEVAPRLALRLRPPREAISHHSDSGRATGGENHRVLLRGCVEMLQYPARQRAAFSPISTSTVASSRVTRLDYERLLLARERASPESDPLHGVMRQSAAGVVAVRVSCGGPHEQHYLFRESKPW